MILLMEEFQLTSWGWKFIPIPLQGFIHPVWCRISSTNSIVVNNWKIQPYKASTETLGGAATSPQQLPAGYVCLTFLCSHLRRCQRRFFQSPNLAQRLRWSWWWATTHRKLTQRTWINMMGRGRFLRKITVFQREIHYYSCAVNKNPLWH